MSAQFLKVKIKSLADEARTIRREERKGGDNRAALHEHRVNVVRPAARSSLLAYGFLRGRSYRSMEAKCHTDPDWKAVAKMVEKYGEGFVGDLTDWREAA